MPWYARYDFVRVESYDPVTGSFDQVWHDDFDKLDVERWEKCHRKSYPGNSSVFMEDQIFITEHGHLIIKLEPDFGNFKSILWQEIAHDKVDDQGVHHYYL